MTTSDIFKNQRPVWKEYKTLFVLARRALPFIIGVAIGGFIFSTDPGYITNLYTEILSIAATVGILDYLNELRRKQELETDLKQRLLREVRSDRSDTSIPAVEEIRDRGWLHGEDGLLKNADLRGANLSGANLFGANLSGAILTSANLAGANLKYAILSSADLQFSILTEVDLQDANLSGTNLFGANLSNACLLRTNLSGSSLMHSNLSGAKFQYVDLIGSYLWWANVDRIQLINPHLPDGEWAEIDLETFIDSSHQDFNSKLKKIDDIRVALKVKVIDPNDPFSLL